MSNVRYIVTHTVIIPVVVLCACLIGAKISDIRAADAKDCQTREKAKAEVERIADYPCTCGTNRTWMAHVTNEVLSVEDIGERYVVQTHHYYPMARDSEGNTFRIEVAVRYPKQYLRKGEPTDTSISNETCFCGGPWEFTTNGCFKCERITKRTGMNCFKCGGYVWETNGFTRVKDEGADNGK